MSETGKVALVIGGSRGIGRAIVNRLARSGFDIWLSYHNNHMAAQETCAAVEAVGRNCRLLAFDLASREATRSALELSRFCRRAVRTCWSLMRGSHAIICLRL